MGGAAKSSPGAGQPEGFNARGGNQLGLVGGATQQSSSQENEALEKAARNGQDELVN